MLARDERAVWFVKWSKPHRALVTTIQLFRSRTLKNHFPMRLLINRQVGCRDQEDSKLHWSLKAQEVLILASVWQLGRGSETKAARRRMCGAEPQCNVVSQLPDGKPRAMRAKASRDERARRKTAADGAKSAQSPVTTGAHVGHGGIRFKTFCATTETILQLSRQLRAAARSPVDGLAHNGPARIRGRGDCGACAV